MMNLKTNISIIMHTSEKKLTSNTAWVTKQALNNCSIYTRGERYAPFDSSSVLLNEYFPLFLFPDSDAVVLDQKFISTITRPIQLIVPDGSWHQAQKVKSREKGFHFIRSVCLKKNYQSIYSLRRAPFAGALCTLEAISYALLEIEGERPFLYLRELLRTMVDRTDLIRKGYNQPLS